MNASRVPALGPRGEGWVALQLLALGAVVVVAIAGPRWSGPARGVAWSVGLVAIAIGAWLAWSGVRALGASLTAAPMPRPDGALREDGVYGAVRHPIYGGLLLIGLGVVLLGSPSAFAPWALLLLILWGKSSREETWLGERFPGYGAYRDRVRKRFVPFVV